MSKRVHRFWFDICIISLKVKFHLLYVLTVFTKPLFLHVVFLDAPVSSSPANPDMLVQSVYGVTIPLSPHYYCDNYVLFYRVAAKIGLKKTVMCSPLKF